ncbi:RTA1 like protein-domain-containing protein [Tricladium varicosporioides]|nr:RTA1 like protein-domain-containing protein [Hymenoscyphus varicosporioides]
MANPEDGGGFALYRYSPSVALAAIASALFGVITILHCIRMTRCHCWFLIPLVIGGFFEIVGFAGRAFSAKETPTWTLGPYIVQSVLLLIAPALFAGSIYMILGRIIQMTDGESHSIIRNKWLTKLFVTGDVLAFTVQAGGAGLMSAGSLSAMKTGEHIVIAGLLIQILFFGLFVTVAFAFHFRMYKVPTRKVANEYLPWQKHLSALYLSTILIMIRSIFRVIEFVQGNSGYIFSHEWFMYVFDALLMLGVLVLFCIVYPGAIQKYLKGSGLTSPELSESLMLPIRKK